MCEHAINFPAPRVPPCSPQLTPYPPPSTPHTPSSCHTPCLPTRSKKAVASPAYADLVVSMWSAAPQVWTREDRSRGV